MSVCFHVWQGEDKQRMAISCASAFVDDGIIARCFIEDLPLFMDMYPDNAAFNQLQNPFIREWWDSRDLERATLQEWVKLQVSHDNCHTVCMMNIAVPW